MAYDHIDCWVREIDTDVYHPLDHRGVILLSVSCGLSELPYGAEIIGDVSWQSGMLMQFPYENSVFVRKVYEG